jgi:hypothetical protein
MCILFCTSEKLCKNTRLHTGENMHSPAHWWELALSYALVEIFHFTLHWWKLCTLPPHLWETVHSPPPLSTLFFLHWWKLFTLLRTGEKCALSPALVEKYSLSSALVKNVHSPLHKWNTVQHSPLYWRKLCTLFYTGGNLCTPLRASVKLYTLLCTDGKLCLSSALVENCALSSPLVENCAPSSALGGNCTYPLHRWKTVHTCGN